MAKKISFEDSINKLRDIVNTLESGTVSLDDSIKLFDEGAKLSAQCYEILAKAELKIKEISSTSFENKGNDINE